MCHKRATNSKNAPQPKGQRASFLNVCLDLRGGIPYGIRTRVAAVKGRCPKPLDERDLGYIILNKMLQLNQVKFNLIEKITINNSQLRFTIKTIFS